MRNVNRERVLCGNFLVIGGILVSSSGIIALLTLPNLWRTDVNKAIQSLPNASPPKDIPGACEMDCMWACVQDVNCLAYSFDASDGTCKTWNHLLIELVDKPKAKSFFRSMSSVPLPDLFAGYAPSVHSPIKGLGSPEPFIV